MSSSATTLFIADIHLPHDQVDHPLTQAFLSFLHTEATDAKCLYILGDLFDGWLGDDIGLQQYETVISALANYAQAGHGLWIGHGNRDFLLKQDFFDATHAHFLAEETELDLGSVRAVLLHGDSLCTEDHGYQAFRQQVLSAEWQAQVLALSIAERLALLAKIKSQSQRESTYKTEAMMDVTQEGLDSLWQRHPTCQHIIHGHTHKPTHHIDQKGRHRWVVGDWHPKGIMLRCTSSDDMQLH